MLNHVPQEAAQGSVSLKERPKGTKRRWYSEQEKSDALAALEANGGNVWGTAKQLGMPAPTLNLWAGVTRGRLDMVRAQPIAPVEVQEQSKRDYASKLLEARWLYLDRATEPDAVAKTSGYYAAVTTKILTEQHQLLTGGATSRTELSLATFLGSTSPASLPGGDGTNAEVGGG